MMSASPVTNQLPNMKITELQKAALVYFVEKQGDQPKNYANSLESLSSKKLLKYVNGSGWMLTDKGNTFYYSL